MVDGTAYGTLAAVASALVRQYGSRDPVTLAVPGAGPPTPCMSRLRRLTVMTPCCRSTTPPTRP
ncbi:hypothetical protein RAA17_14455 [Komagataeibacter rhaeticus]|nr:hypothetical protein [Komagataeibacter rhaeticus]